MWSRSLVVIFTVALLAGCTRGVSPDSPVAPTPPAQTVARLTITPLGGGNILVGGTAPIATSGGLPSTGVALGAFAEYSNGPGHYVEATWTSSDSSVLMVSGNVLTAIKRGTATLTATFQGQSDTEEFVVDGGIAGRWAGSYVVERCSGNTGSMQEVLCGHAPTGRTGIAQVGATLPFSMELVEISATELTGTVSFGNIRGTLPGVNRGAGFFYLQGEIAGAGGVINIAHWDTRVLRDAMEGFVTYQVKIDGLPGIGTVAVKLTGMTRR